MKPVQLCIAWIMILVSQIANAQWLKSTVDIGPGQHNSVMFSNESHGFITSRFDSGPSEPFQGAIHRTEDGGETWQEILSSPGSWINEIQFVNDTLGFVSTRLDNIFRTEDGGSTWDSIPIEGEPVTFPEIHMVTHLVGYTANWRGEVFKTVDGGLVWTKIYQIGFPFIPINCVTCLTEEKCFFGFFSSGGAVLSTLDGGDSWDSNFFPGLSSLGIVNGIEKLDDNSLIAVGGSNLTSTSGGYIMISEDEGDSWQFVYQNENFGLTDIKMVGDIGYACGSHETILHTMDAGETWEIVNQVDTAGLGSNMLLDIHMLDENRGVISGKDSILYRLGIYTSVVSDTEQQSSVSFFPNPVKDMVNIKINRADIRHAVFNLFDITGSLVLSTDLGTYATLNSIDLSHLNRGVYTFSIFQNEEVLDTGKLIRQ